MGCYYACITKSRSRFAICAGIAATWRSWLRRWCYKKRCSYWLMTTFYVANGFSTLWVNKFNVRFLVESRSCGNCDETNEEEEEDAVPRGNIVWSRIVSTYCRYFFSFCSACNFSFSSRFWSCLAFSRSRRSARSCAFVFISRTPCRFDMLCDCENWHCNV